MPGLVTASVYVPGTIHTLGWSNVVVTVDTIPLDNLSSLKCLSNINFGSGTASVEAGDPLRSQYDTLVTGKEIEIYLKLPNINIANKVWGGFLESTSWKEDGTNYLELSAKEYSQRLVANKLNTPLSWVGSDLKQALLDILATQSDLTYDFISAMDNTGYAINTSFTADTVIYDAIRSLCEQCNYYFGVSVLKDCYIRAKTAIALSADTLTAGVNVLSQNEIQTNKEFQLTSVAVKSTGGIVGTASGTVAALAQTRTVYIAGLSTNAAATTYAQSLIANNQSPLFTSSIPSSLLMYTQPTMTIPVDIPMKNLVGNYLVVEVQHEWSADKGIKTTTQLSNKIIDTTMELGFISRRLTAVESKTLT